MKTLKRVKKAIVQTNERLNLIKKIDEAQEQEMIWFEEGRRLKNQYKARYKEEI